MNNHYQTLGVPRNATQAQIKTAYRARARAFHPDHNPHPGSARRFVEVKRAYEVLSNAARRRQYDLILDGVRVRRSKKGPTAHARPEPPKDDRKYGTRHRYTNPPPTRAEQEKKYREVLEYYRLFNRKGMRLPRKEWWKRFNAVLREGSKFKGFVGFFGNAVVGTLFATYLFLSNGFNAIGFFWLMASVVFLRLGYRNTIRNIAERKKKK